MKKIILLILSVLALATAGAAANGFAADSQVLLETPSRVIEWPDAQNPTGSGGDGRENSDPRLLVVGRPISVGETQPGDWEKTGEENGRTYWRLSARSEGAFSLRVHFVPSGDEEEIAVYGSSGRIRTLQVRTTPFWAPPVAGDIIFIAAVVAGDGPPGLSIDRAVRGTKDFFRVLKEGSCHLDVNCYEDWAQEKTAVGYMLYEDDASGEVICTGSLLADEKDTGQPWLLSAYHCVNSEREARSLVVYWTYETDVCNGIPVDFETCPTSEGADFLVGSDTSDFALMLLDEDPPAGTARLAWSRNDIGDGAEVTVIHHPDGSFKRISFGNSQGTEEDYFIVRYYEGSTEPGSSGSPLFNAEKKVIGQLSAGDASCYFMQGTDTYGMLGKSWDLGLAEFLSNGVVPTTTTTTIPPGSNKSGSGDDDDDSNCGCGC